MIIQTIKSAQHIKSMQKAFRKIPIEDQFHHELDSHEKRILKESILFGPWKNQKVQCQNCSIAREKVKELKLAIDDLQKEKTSLMCEIELHLSHFSYIIELVSNNISEKHSEFLRKLKLKRQATSQEMTNEKESQYLKLIAAQKNQIELLKQKADELESQNSCYKSSLKKSIETGSNSSSSALEEQCDELPYFGPTKNERRKVEGGISLPLISAQKKQQSLGELRGRLNQLRHRISKMSQSQVFCSDF